MPTVLLSNDRQTPKDIERALRTLKNKVEDCGILKTLQLKAAYERPGDKRKRMKAAAKQRWKRELAKSQLPQKLY
jgi:ribosomal protein S21